MSLALLSGALNALFMTPRSDWYHSLKMPSLSPAFHSAAWLICYIAFAVVFAEFLSEKELRKYLWATVPFPVGNALWCAVFSVYTMRSRLSLSSAPFALLWFS